MKKYLKSITVLYISRRYIKILHNNNSNNINSLISMKIFKYLEISLYFFLYIFVYFKLNNNYYNRLLLL